MANDCCVPDCETGVLARGMCNKHYQRWRKYGDPNGAAPRPIKPDECSVDGCDRTVLARGWCRRHYTRWKAHGDPLKTKIQRNEGARCSVPECPKDALTNGMCNRHYRRSKKYGDPEAPARKPGRPKTQCRECGEPVFGHGLCNRHYKRWRKYGTTELPPADQLPSGKAVGPAKDPLELGEEDLAWAAGFLDGEGAFFIAEKPDRRNGTVIRYAPTVSAEQTSRVPLLKLQQMFGGSLNVAERKTNIGNHVYKWSVNSNDLLRRCLPALIPHLVIRREEASVLLKYASSVRVKGSGRPLAEAEVQARDELRRKLRTANAARFTQASAQPAEPASPAWAAGYFDGEAHLSTSGLRGMRIAVTSVDRRSLDALVAAFGGKVRSKRPGNDRHRECYAWALHARDDALAALDVVSPHLVLKRQQAELIRRYTMLPASRHEAVDEREELKHAVRALHGRRLHRSAR